MATPGKPLYDGVLNYCTRCCMPETLEGVSFDELGICTACRSSEDKMHIDWAAREQELRKLLAFHKSRSGSNYDCIAPISGGKDSTFQLHVLVKRYGMKPLAVTFNHNWYTQTGLDNLHNALETFQVDHIMFTPHRSLINALAKKSLPMIGDACWHCHMGVGAFPLQIAVKFKIPLLIWGESLSENDGRATYFEGVTRYDRDYFTKVSARVEADGMVDETITPKDIHPFQLPSVEEIERAGVVGIHLGDYMFWDDERQMEFVKRVYGWREDVVEGTYKGYKSVECIMAGVHDYAKFIKRGFGRGSDHASADARAGLLTREEAFELAKRADSARPRALDYYLQITGMTEREFIDTLVALRQGKAKALPTDYTTKNPSDATRPLRPAIVERLERGGG
ncbi:MAG: N-acetyl sugar amidotransferase [Candidatus Omnitrophica bacterium]|nr:N-acetyl sugar amidotransferase [Candidatus Omnitrophota bacterium]